MIYDQLAALRDAADRATAAWAGAHHRRIPPADAARLQQAAAAATAHYHAALASTIGDLDPAVPLLLLPVRLETRFRPRPGGSTVDLLIRVYPDDVHLDSHEPGLVPAEIEAGQRFWTSSWAATSDAERAAAWARLVGQVGATRASWVATALTPTNDPGSGQPPVFPAPAQQASRWTRAALAQGLPDQWTALAYRDGVRMAQASGGLITRPLAASLSPVDSSDLTDPAMRWLVDFTAAQTAGMGLVLTLTADQAQRIDLLLVTGVRGSDTAPDTSAAVTALLAAHRYTRGLDLVPTGTPTNNTPGVRAATPTSPGPTASPAAGSDVRQLTRALGLTAPAPLDSVGHAGLHDQDDATDLATVLWPATWGYFLAQLMRPLFADAALDQWRQWTVNSVRARGPLPALRIGDQPYGVLPVTSLDRWRQNPDQPELLVLRTVSHAGRPATALGVLWDLDADGGWSDLSPPAAVATPVGNPVGTGLAAVDLDGDGQLELVVGWLAPNSTAAGYSVLRLNPDGSPGPELVQGAIPLDTPASTLTLAVADLTGSGPDLVVVAQHNPARGTATPHTSLQIGTGLSPTRAISRWVAPSTVDGVAPTERLLGTTVADVTGDGRPDLLVLFDAAGVVRYRVGTGVLGERTRLTWSAPVDVTPPGAPSTAGGITVSDVDGDGAPEVIVHYSWDGGGVAAGAYRVADQLDPAGLPGRWLGIYNTGSAWPGVPLAGGLALANLGRSPHAGWSTTAGRINLLQRLRGVWQAAATTVARAVGSANPDQAMLDVLATDATSTGVAVRPLIGPQFAHGLWFAMNQPLAASYETGLQQQLAPVLDLFGLTGPPRLSSLAYATHVSGETVGYDTDAPTDYLASMVDATPQQLHDGWTGPGTPLLARLVRHSLLQAYADAALLVVPVPGNPPPPPPEPELVDLADITAGDPSTPVHSYTSWRHLAETTVAGRPMADVLYQAARAANPPVEAVPLAAVIAALRRLAAAPPASVHRLLAETLDLSSHRLDAWLTSVATNRLRELRRVRPTGVHIGGYGIVTDLHPATGPASTGFVHAPSLNHAATAAVLRSGYLTHGDPALAVDLTATRVRAAQELLDGVRAGQPLGALLGYRFEQELADRGLSAYLPTLRQLAPEVVGQLTPVPPGTPVEAVSALATVDGIALLRQTIPWGTTVPGQPVGLPAPGTPDQVALAAALAATQDAVDAASDIGVAESVHQTLQGNHLRAGGSLDALARGELPPPEPEVLRSPRTGTGLTHRVLILTGDPGAGTALAAWTATTTQAAAWVRAAAEPRLNAWAATVLGDPGRVHWRAAFVDPATGAPSGHPEREFTLAGAGLSPVDVLYGPSPAVAALTETDLGRRLLAVAAAAAAAYFPVVAPVLVTQRDPAWGPDILSLGELLTVAELARDLVGGARAADARDLAPSGVVVDPGVDQSELEGRAATALAGLTDALTLLRSPFLLQAGDAALLRTALAAPDIPDDLGSLLELPGHVDIGAACAVLSRPAVAALDQVRAPLTQLAAFGVDGAAPRAVVGADEATRASLAGQARGAYQVAAGRRATAAAATDAGTRIEAVFGPGFRVLPVFTPANPADLGQALALRTQAGDTPQWTIEGWLDDAAAVRAGVQRLGDVRLIAPAAGGGTNPLAALQLPPRAGDPWLGATWPAGVSLPAGLTGILVDADPAWRPDLGQAGLVVDEWVEVVPNAMETTGLALHYDAPGASAPQALLLAASPDPGRPWDLSTLEAVLLETVDATRIRAVQSPQLSQVGHVLPALFLARNAGGDPAGDTIATTVQG